MGVVYKALDTKLKRPVALKFLRADVVEDAEAKERFLREAQAAAALDHPNICTVYEIDEAEEQTFLAMAFIEGRTVKDKISDRPLKLDEAVDIAVQTAEEASGRFSANEPAQHGGIGGYPYDPNENQNHRRHDVGFAVLHVGDDRAAHVGAQEQDAPGGRARNQEQ